MSWRPAIRIPPAVGRARRWTSSAAIILATAAPILAPTAARAQGTASVRVEETGGIRRTNFPVRAHVELPSGRLSDASHIQLVDGDTEVPAQGTALSTWPDGSVQGLDVDFNLSLAPMEAKTLDLRYGPEVTASPPQGRGLLSVTEDADAIEVGGIRFNRSGSPLLLSVAYRNELIVDGANGLVVTDDAGVRHDPSEIAWSAVDVVKPGPLLVQLRYQGRLNLGGGSVAGVVLDLEMPNSKSWLRISASVSDLGRKVREVAIETPIGLGDYPWSWDFATPNGTYGAFRNETGSVVMTRTTDASGRGAWEVLTGSVGEERPYEESVPGRSETARGWVHLQSAAEGVAFAIEGVGERAGTLTATLNGGGRTSFAFAPSEPATDQALVVYEHYVSVPLSIGAATSPASILSPLAVTAIP